MPIVIFAIQRTQDSYSEMAIFSDLPLELQGEILALGLQPKDRDEFWEQRNVSRVRSSPLKMLTRRRRSTMLNKKTYEIALPAYFAETQLNAVFDDMFLPRNPCMRPRSWCDEETRTKIGHSIVAGTFQTHELFYDNTVKLRLELASPESTKVAKTLLSKCKRIAKVTVCYHRLAAEDVAEAEMHIEEAVEIAKINGKDRNIICIADNEETCEYLESKRLEKIRSEKAERDRIAKMQEALAAIESEERTRMTSKKKTRTRKMKVSRVPDEATVDDYEGEDDGELWMDF